MKRPAHPMPEFVRSAMESAGLRERYEQRPWYQRNDYLSWICSAKLEQTKLKQLNQMLDELEAGDVYIKMDWRPRSR